MTRGRVCAIFCSSAMQAGRSFADFVDLRVVRFVCTRGTEESVGQSSTARTIHSVAHQAHSREARPPKDAILWGRVLWVVCAKRRSMSTRHMPQASLHRREQPRRSLFTGVILSEILSAMSHRIAFEAAQAATCAGHTVPSEPIALLPFSLLPEAPTHNTEDDTLHFTKHV